MNIRGGFLSDIDIIDLLANAEATVDEPKPEPVDYPAVRLALKHQVEMTSPPVSPELYAAALPLVNELCALLASSARLPIPVESK